MRPTSMDQELSPLDQVPSRGTHHEGRPGARQQASPGTDTTAQFTLLRALLDRFAAEAMEAFAALLQTNGTFTPLTPEEARQVASLTERQKQVMRLRCDAHEWSLDQIADRMGISRNAVDKLIHRLYEKFNVHSIVGLFGIAVRSGVVKL